MLSGLVVWRSGDLGIWRSGGLAVWWSGGLVVWRSVGLVVYGSDHLKHCEAARRNATAPSYSSSDNDE